METLKLLIASHPFFRSLAPAYLEILAQCAGKKEFQAGEIIFREGEVADRFYLIREGKVTLESRVSGSLSLTIQDVGAEEVLGWSWLFPPYVWHFQAKAIERTQTVAFDGAHLLIACEKNHEFGYELMKRLAQVLIRRLQATQKQFVKLHASRQVP